uniref:thioredoxin-dependent peroxiredoxin n=1 Tax=Salvator merianae TaxID=96440 RepID=A0A8D0BFW4_SALMN
MASGCVGAPGMKDPKSPAHAQHQSWLQEILISLATQENVLRLLFYALDFSFVCPTDIITFSGRSNEFKKINCEVIGASVDAPFCHLIPLVSDTKCAIAKKYGVLK